MEGMSLTSGARAQRATRAVRGPLRSSLTAGLIILALIAGSGTTSYAQSSPIVNDPLTDPSLSTSWRGGRAPSSPGSEIGTGYSDDGFHITIYRDQDPGLRADLPFTGGSHLQANTNLDAALQAGGAGANQSIEVDVAQVDGDVNNAYGVACRTTNGATGVFQIPVTTAGYVLWAGSDGTAGIWKLVSDASGSRLLKLTPQTNIPADTTYHLRADCNGSRLALSVNGAKVAEAQDGDYKSGSVGLFVGTTDATGIDVAFTNLSISRP